MKPTLGDTLVAILTVAVIVLVAVLAVKGVEKLLGRIEVAPAPASDCVSEYLLGDPQDLAAHILGDTAEDFAAFWVMQDGEPSLVALNDGLAYRWSICPVAQTELTWELMGDPVPVVQSE